MIKNFTGHAPHTHPASQPPLQRVSPVNALEDPPRDPMASTGLTTQQRSLGPLVPLCWHLRATAHTYFPRSCWHPALLTQSAVVRSHVAVSQHIGRAEQLQQEARAAPPGPLPWKGKPSACQKTQTQDQHRVSRRRLHGRSPSCVWSLSACAAP